MNPTTAPVIFDLDGILVDPAQGIADGIAAALCASAANVAVVPDTAVLHETIVRRDFILAGALDTDALQTLNEVPINGNV